MYVSSVFLHKTKFAISLPLIYPCGFGDRHYGPKDSSQLCLHVQYTPLLNRYCLPLLYVV